MAASAAAYPFDQSEHREHKRLTGLQKWADPASFRLLDQIGIERGWRCLDVGAGAGSVTRFLSQRVGAEGSVVSTDLEAELLEPLVHRPNVEVRRLDLESELPQRSFDLAHARFVLVHLPGRDAALERMVESVRPGGWLVVTDIDWRTCATSHPSPASDRVEEGYRRVLAATGLELDYGARLPERLEALGLTDVQGEAFVRYSRGDTIGPHVYRLSIERLRADIVSSGAATTTDIEELRSLLLDPAYGIFSPTVWTVWGRRPLS